MQILKKSLFTAITTIVLGAGVVLAAPGKPFSDEWVEGRIHGALAYNAYLDSSDLEVTNTKGAVTLTGKVSSDTERELAEEITTSIDGVVSVNNKIEIDPELAPRSRPSWLQRFIDATTTAAVKSRLLSNKSMHDIVIHIQTKDGVVLLTGTVASLEQQKNAEQITLNTRDVRDVQNELKISEPSNLSEKANNASVNVSRSVSDAWISSKIRSSLLFSSDFPGSSVSVSTKDGVVTVSGTARNATQRSEIEHMINDFYGVRDVENNLKIRI